MTLEERINQMENEIIKLRMEVTHKQKIKEELEKVKLTRRPWNEFEHELVQDNLNKHVEYLMMVTGRTRQSLIWEMWRVLSSWKV